MNKQSMVYSYNGILFSNKMEQRTDIHSNVNETQKRDEIQDNSIGKQSFQ